MYAAAGGASIASRQARQKQRQNKNKKITEMQKSAKTAAQVPQLIPKPPQSQSKQFHNLPPGYLSRVERGTLRPPQVERRHSTSNHLKEPPRSKIRESPSIMIPVQNHLTASGGGPLTPGGMTPGGMAPSPSVASHLGDLLTTGKLERKCSIVRQHEEMERDAEKGLVGDCNHINNFNTADIRDPAGGRGWDGNPLLYSDVGFGSMDYPFSECSQGRAAWQERERGRRCSLTEEAAQHRLKQTEAHHRWMKRNRIHDASFGGSSEEDFFSVYHQSAAANALLYVGLGTASIGSIIFFVGTGEKGFKTLELRLIGPVLVACGLLCCLIRVLLCACPSKCIRRRKKTRLKKDTVEVRELVDHTTALLGAGGGGGGSRRHQQHGSKKRVCIAPQTAGPSTEFAQCTPHDNPTTTMATALVTQQHQQPPIPLISVPDFADFTRTGFPHRESDLSRDASLIELANLDINIEVSSVSSQDSDGSCGASVTIIETTATVRPSKLARAREPQNSRREDEPGFSGVSGATLEITELETSLSVPQVSTSRCPPPVTSEKPSHSGIVLSPSQLGQ